MELPLRTLDCVAAIYDISGLADESGQPHINFLGTGFSTEMPIGTTDKEPAFAAPTFVSAAHVWKKTPNPKIIKSPGTPEIAGQWLVSSPHRLNFHADGLDVGSSLLPVSRDNLNLPETEMPRFGDSVSVDLRTAPVLQLATREMLQELNIAEGDECFIIGYPSGQTGVTGHLTPLVLRSSIARIQSWYSRNERRILVNQVIDEGLSGAPVVLHPKYVQQIQTGPSIVTPEQRVPVLVIGLVSGFRTQTVRTPNETFPSNLFDLHSASSITEITPADVISETIPHLPNSPSMSTLEIMPQTVQASLDGSRFRLPVHSDDESVAIIPPDPKLTQT